MPLLRASVVASEDQTLALELPSGGGHQLVNPECCGQSMDRPRDPALSAATWEDYLRIEALTLLLAI